MQFYTKLGHAKIIIFLPCGIHLQCLFPGEFSDAIYFMDAHTDFIFYYLHLRKRFCLFYESCGERLLWHFTYQKKIIIMAASSPLADNC